MNKQDAIEILEEVKMFDDSMYSYKPAYCEALDMAIDALKADEVECIPIPFIKQLEKVTGDPALSLLLMAWEMNKLKWRAEQAERKEE